MFLISTSYHGRNYSFQNLKNFCKKFSIHLFWGRNKKNFRNFVNFLLFDGLWRVIGHYQTYTKIEFFLALITFFGWDHWHGERVFIEFVSIEVDVPGLWKLRVDGNRHFTISGLEFAAQLWTYSWFLIKLWKHWLFQSNVASSQSYKVFPQSRSSRKKTNQHINPLLQIMSSRPKTAFL